MKNLVKRGLTLLLVLAVCISLLPALTLTADAVTVNYVKDGKYVYNWGTREETATFLSPMAEDFYEANNITYEDLAALSGSATTNSVPSSALYKKLQNLMKSNHDYETSYNATKNLFKYTDCQNGGGKISSFYSGAAIGPEWGSSPTWNREHTWPNSKGDASGNGENDIIMLRPTAMTENSSRGNKAYGRTTSSSYYNPNDEADGKYDLRGDVARIMLFVYCRWGNTGSMWGASGVIESREVLLEWVEDDPVDTWELGRNDAVESITGTRNVFVDYPELIFIMFGGEIPEGMETPSGNAKTCPHTNSYAIAAKPATCTTPGNTAGRHCNDCGKDYDGYTVIAATGHSYTGVVTPPTEAAGGYTTYTCGACGHSYVGNYTGALGTSYTVSFAVPTGVAAVGSMGCNNNGITLPNAGVPSGDTHYTFVGWTTAPVEDQTAAPTIYKAGAKFTTATNTTLYALYTYGVGGSGVAEYVLTDLSKIEDTDTVVITVDYQGTVYAMTNSNGTSAAPDAVIVSVSNNKLTATPADTLKWNIVSTTSGYIIYPAGQTSKWLYSTASNNGIRVGTGTAKEFSFKSNYLYNNAQGRYMGVYRTNPDWRSYTSIHSNIANETYGFYVKTEAGTLHYTTLTGEHTHTYSTTITAPTCTEKGYTTHTCTHCGESFVDSYVDATGVHSYDNGVCTVCGVSILGSDWIAPNLAKGDYTMVVLPDTQNLITYWPEVYYDQMQWIADNQDALNIQAVFHMGDMVNNNTDTEWTVCEAGTDLINATGIPWMPMRGNHDDSVWFNRYYDYSTYGTNQSWFGGSYEEGKLDHTYWFVTAGEREYLILSLGWVPSGEVLAWAQGIVEENADKSVILTCHAYMNSNNSLLASGEEVWNAFKSYSNVVLAMGGHVHSADLVTWVGQNGAGQDVTSLLVDRQSDDINDRLGMVAILTFHADSNCVDVNWYSTRLDALYREKNQFTISVPHVCIHSYTSVVAEPTCTEGGGTRHTCTICGDSYVDSYVSALGHDEVSHDAQAPTCTAIGWDAYVTCSRCDYSTYAEKPATGHNHKAVVTAPTCTEQGYTTHTCTLCGDSYVADKVAAKGHTPGAAATCTTAQTCTVCGAELAPTKDHNWKAATCTAPKTCTTCGTTEGNALGHTEKVLPMVASTCTATGLTVGKECTACGETLIAQLVTPAKGHTDTNRDFVCDICQEDLCTTHVEETIPGKAATCTETGLTEGKKCSVCGEIIVKQTVIDALEHQHETIPGKAATCTEFGLTAGEKCSVCGTVLVAQQTISANGHNWKNATCTTPKTCSTCGTTEGTAKGHAWKAATCTTPKTCTTCGTTEGTAKGHSWKAATCTTPKTCSTCDTTEGTAKGHSWKAATCTTPKTCSTCGATEGTAKGHRWKAATCTTPKTCTTCGATEGTAKGHSWKAATCTTPKTCATCGITEGTAKGHTWKTATCTTPKTCTTCGVTSGAANGHSWKSATCTTPKTCTTCGVTSGTANGHTWQAATCTTPKTCSTCGTTEGTAKGHSWKAATCTTPKTCTTCGATSGTANGHTWRQASCTSPRTCTTCKLTEGSALGHNWQEATCDKPMICSRCKASSGRPAGHTYDDGVDGTCNGCGIHREDTENRTVMHMFRMYDPNSGEHFYTGSTVERDNLVAAGWNYEGVGFTFSLTTGAPVYRLYDRYDTFEHLYTMDVEERDRLVADGWELEGIAFNSAYDTEVPQYRLHNPNETRGAYHFTASEEERDALIAAGWEYQGIGFYSSWK